MFKFKKEKREEFLQGRTIKYVASNILFITPQYLTLILNNKSLCSKAIANSITKCANQEATIDDFFDYE